MAAPNPVAPVAQNWVNATNALANVVAQHLQAPPAQPALQQVQQTQAQMQQTQAQMQQTLVQIQQTLALVLQAVQGLEARQERHEVNARAMHVNSRADYNLTPLVWLLNAQGQVPGPQVTKQHIRDVANAAQIDGYLDHYGLQHAGMPIAQRENLLLEHLGAAL